MKAKITVKTLNTKSIDRAIAEVKGRKQYTEERVRKITKALERRGEEIARALIAEYTDGTGNLADHIVVWTEFIDGKFKTYIKLDTEYAAYVEFGTGIVGESNPHPNIGRRGWAYDVNGHGEAGWVYPKDGEFYWTQGQPAKPIMYETLQQLKAEFPAIVKEVFSH